MSTWSSIIDNKGSPWSTKDVDVGKVHAKSGCQKQREVNLHLCWFLLFQKLKALSSKIPVAGNFQSWSSSLSSLLEVLCNCVCSNQRNDTARRWNKFIVIWYIQNRIGKSQNRQWFSILFSNCPQSSPEISLPPGGWLSVLSLDSCTSVLAQHSRIQHRIFRIFNSVFSSGLVGF